MPSPVITCLTPSGVPLGPGSFIRYSVDGDVLAGDSLFIALEVDRVGTPTQVQFAVTAFTANHSSSLLTPPMYVSFYTRFEGGGVITGIGGGADWPGVDESITLHHRYIRGISIIVDGTTSGFHWHGDAGFHNLWYCINRVPTSNATDSLAELVSHTYQNQP